MGTSSSYNKQHTTPTSDPSSTPNPNTSILSHKDYDDEFDTQIQSEMHNCCGVQLNKKKKGNDMLNWEDTAVIGCQRAGEGVCWVQAIRQVVKKKGGNRKKFIREYNDIKYLQKQPTKSQREAPLNATEISNFKSNLKKSVLLHPTQVLHPSQQQNANSAHISFRQSLRQQNLHSSILRQNPKKSLITQNKQNNLVVKDNNLTANRDDSVLSISRITKAVNRENLRQSVIGLVDDTVSSMFKGQEQEVIKLNAYQLQVFVKFTVMLQRHLTDPQHKINQIILAFCSSLYKSYPQFLKPNSDPLLLLQMQHFLDTIRLFLQFLTQIVLDYYNISQAPQPPLPKDTTLSVIQLKSFHTNMMNQQVPNHLINNYQNIYTIVTAILFKDQRFYSFVFDVVRAFNRQHDSRAARLFEKLHGRGPQCFNVRKQYCLNSGTLKNIIDGMSLQSNIQNLVPEDLCSTTDQPYKKCSQPLKKLQKQRTPISKMKSILECAQKITEQITQFYENNNTNININYKMIDADQVLSIFCYILSINKIQNIYSHCFIIQHFATEFQKMSMTGYYYSVVCCAVEEDFGEDRLQKEQQLQIRIKQQEKKIQQQEKKVQQQENKVQQQESKVQQQNEYNVKQQNGNKQGAVLNGNKQKTIDQHEKTHNIPIIANSELSSKLQANQVDKIKKGEEKDPEI